MQKDLYKKLEEARRQAHVCVDLKFDMAFAQALGVRRDEGRRIAPLATEPHRFKGGKVKAVVLPHGASVPVKNWKEAVAAVFRDCDGDPQCHEQLMAMRNKVLGRSRVLLTDDPQRLDAPLRINDSLFLEGKQDMEVFLKLAVRILEHTGYAYEKIGVELEPVQEEAENMENQNGSLSLTL